MAMQTKAIDAQENPTQIIIVNRFQEVQKYMSLTRHAYTVGPLTMNLKKFNSLPTASAGHTAGRGPNHGEKPSSDPPAA